MRKSTFMFQNLELFQNHLRKCECVFWHITVALSSSIARDAQVNTRLWTTLEGCMPQIHSHCIIVGILMDTNSFHNLLSIDWTPKYGAIRLWSIGRSHLIVDRSLICWAFHIKHTYYCKEASHKLLKTKRNAN